MALPSVPQVVTSDLHAADKIWVPCPEIIEDSAFAMRQIAAYTISHKYNLALLGDMTEYSDNSSVIMLQGCVEDVLNEGLEVGYLCGNHDKQSWVATSKNMRELVRHLTENQWRLGEHRVYGIDHRPAGDRARMIEEIASIPTDFDILACHQFISPAFMWNTFDFELDQVPPHIKMVICGHLHTKTDIVNTAGTRLLIPGCPFLRRRDDQDEHGFWVVNPDLSYFWMPIFSRPVLRLILENMDQIPQVIESSKKVRMNSIECFRKFEREDVVQEVSKPLVFIQYDPQVIPGAVKDVQGLLGDTAHVFELPLDHSGEVKDTIQVQMHTEQSSEISMEESLPKLVDKETEPDVFDGCLASIRGESPQNVVADLCSKKGISEEATLELIGKGLK